MNKIQTSPFIKIFLFISISIIFGGCYEPPPKHYSVSILPPFTENYLYNYEELCSSLKRTVNSLAYEQSKKKSSFEVNFEIGFKKGLYFQFKNQADNNNFWKKYIIRKDYKPLLRKLCDINELDLLFIYVLSGNDDRMFFRVYMYDHENYTISKSGRKTSYWNGDIDVFNNDIKYITKEVVKNYLK